VFDEERYFDSGEAPCVLTLKGVRCGVNICADVWEAGAADLAREAGAEMLLVLNASLSHRQTRAAYRGPAPAHRQHRPAGDLRQPRRRPGRTGL
jgi:predicted amidohydrolase